MRKLLAVLLLTAALPLGAELGVQENGTLTIVATQGCPSYDFIAKTFSVNPACAWVSIRTKRQDADRFRITLTLNDEEGRQHQLSKAINRDPDYTAVLFAKLPGLHLQTVDIEQVADGVTVESTQFQLD